MRSAQALTPAPRALPHGPAALLVAAHARLRAVAIDGLLAAGAPPWESPVLAARSLQITRERNRRNLARSLERLVEQAERPAPRALSAVIPASRSQVREARPVIQSLASRLRDSDPVDARGVARLVALLSDGRGPLYLAARPGALSAKLEGIAHDLDVND